MRALHTLHFLIFFLIAFPTCQCGNPSIYNNAKVIFHAIGPKFHSPELEGIDPSQSLEVMEVTLGKFIENNPDLSPEMISCMLKLQKSINTAKARYLTCIGLVKLAIESNTEPSSVHETAVQLSNDMQSQTDYESYPPTLFIGGHYRYNERGSLGGHTATYEVNRQADGKLGYFVNNTVKKDEYHESVENKIRQHVYSDLNRTDLDVIFWENVIRTNYMIPQREPKLMDSFYSYIDATLGKTLNNRMSGRSFKLQKVGVCAWKSLSVWLHGQIAPGIHKENRNPAQELIYTRYKKLMFENMLVSFNPDESFKATIKFGKDSNETITNEKAALFLKAELERKIQKMDAKIQKMLAANRAN
jgi:hypothetical protein